jgi:hypothetical protein
LKMPMAEKELLERDAKRDLGVEKHIGGTEA